MLILVHAQRTSRSHGESHGNQTLALDSYSHPACSGLPKNIKVRCPLSDVKWTKLRDVPGGIAMETPSKAENPGLYRMRLLCHMAFAGSQGKSAICPLHVPRVRVSLAVKGKNLVLTMLSGKKHQKAFRRLVRDLFQ